MTKITVQNIAQHLKNIYAEGEVDKKATAEDFSIVQNEGERAIERRTKKAFKNGKQEKEGKELGTRQKNSLPPPVGGWQRVFIYQYFLCPSQHVTITGREYA